MGTRAISAHRQQLQELHHRRLRVEHPLVHVDVDDLRAIGDLIARDLQAAS